MHRCSFWVCFLVLDAHPLSTVGIFSLLPGILAKVCCMSQVQHHKVLRLGIQVVVVDRHKVTVLAQLRILRPD